MKQVLLFDTAIATTNLGDEIILDCVKQGLKPILYDAITYRLGTHIENFNLFQMIKGNYKYYDMCKNADYKFVCGTNLLCDNVFGRFPQWMLYPYNVKLYSECVLVGVGKISAYQRVSRYTEMLYKKCFSREFYHSVRDEETRVIMESMGFKAINTGCPTLWMFTKEKCERIPSSKASKVIISLSGYNNQKNPIYDKKMVDCVFSNYDKVYAWIQTIHDQTYINEICHRGDIEYIYSLEKFSDVLDEGDIDYIGTRLHGGVFALQHECRSIIISIDQRAEGFYKSNNIPIIRRDEIETKLELEINSEWKTDIRVDRESINQFLSQFME